MPTTLGKSVLSGARVFTLTPAGSTGNFIFKSLESGQGPSLALFIGKERLEDSPLF